MPTDKVVNRNFKELFEHPVRFEIPFFQRGYAWEQRQWKKLFEDIDIIIQDAGETGLFEESEHFFGPIVVLQKNFDDPVLKRFLIIDGQQRITTVFLLLSVIQQQIFSMKHLSSEAPAYISELEVLLKNNVSDSDDYKKLKVFSTKGDRLPTFKAVFKSNPTSPYLSDDQQLYDPLTNRIDAFVRFATRFYKDASVTKLRQIFLALTRSFKIVWIPLDENKDDAQAIFESLNDAGMPLSASELLCNYIFRPLTDDSTNAHEKLHNEKWLAARSIVGSANFEEYLRNLFSIGEKKRVGRERRMYVHFKVKNKRLDATLAKATLDQIMDFTKIYNYIRAPRESGFIPENLKGILIAIDDTNMSSCYPFLMALLKANENGQVSDSETIALLQETYILLVRRKVATLPTTKYDSFFPALLEKLLPEPNRIKAFHQTVQKEQLWVADDLFATSFLTKEIYNPSELKFSRHVLVEIDKHMSRFGEFPDYTSLNTIEHILPQTLNQHWKDYLVGDSTHINLPTITNTLGNLCLNSRSANSSFGQLPFLEKQEAYSMLSYLARDVKQRVEPWNIDAIQKRSSDLSSHALEIWKWSI